ncbi:MAG TPA: carbohydrate ABC transporter permease [Bacilli bacterium]
MQRQKAGLLGLEMAMILLALLFIYPILLVVQNSLKTFAEVMTNVIALPKGFAWENYVYVWHEMNYPRLFLNNVIVTGVGVAGTIAIASVATYMLARTKGKTSTFIYLFCILPMLIPFQSIMVTVLKLMKMLHLSDSVWGLGVQYWGFAAPMAVFIYHGFVKSVPKELDESAKMDGASTFQTFYKIIFPLLKPVTTTVFIIDVMWFWNDFLLPLIMVNGLQSTKTLTLAAYTFVGQYNTDWQYAMTAMFMAVFPSILVFIFLQKFIVKGVVAGAVKG